jgi:hypothetical protein
MARVQPWWTHTFAFASVWWWQARWTKTRFDPSILRCGSRSRWHNLVRLSSSADARRPIGGIHLFSWFGPSRVHCRPYRQYGLSVCVSAGEWTSCDRLPMILAAKQAYGVRSTVRDVFPWLACNLGGPTRLRLRLYGGGKPDGPTPGLIRVSLRCRSCNQWHSLVWLSLMRILADRLE